MAKREYSKQNKTGANSGPELPPLPGDPRILPRSEHRVSRKLIDPDALKVLRRLNRFGHRAFLVGGGVRDLLLEKSPKDFDISTDAKPEEIRKIFRNCRIIGRRFKLIHVYFRGNKIIELATFRDASDVPETIEEDDGEVVDEEKPKMLAADNTYGDAQTDALRRDLTINGLFYDISSFSVIDYVGGIDDLNNKIIRIIGDPEVRIQEDPIRMIRALRHAARADFQIASETYDAILKLRHLIELCPHVRVFEEFVKDLRSGSITAIFEHFDRAGFINFLIPLLSRSLSDDRETVWKRLKGVLQGIDKLNNSGYEIPMSVAFLSLMIGNFPKGYFGGSELYPEVSRLRNYWEVSPAYAIDEKQSEEADSEVSLTWGPRLSGSDEASIDMRRSVSEVIDEVYQPIGVYRKDREEMEKLLVLRYDLLRAYAEDNDSLVDTKRALIPHAIILLGLTAHDDVSRGACDFWKDRLGEFPQKETPKRGRRPVVGRAQRSRPKNNNRRRKSKSKDSK